MASKACLLFFLFGYCAYLAAGAPNACTHQHKQGTCSCHLADGSGIIDLASYVELTKNMALTAVDPNNQWIYDFSFCNAINEKPEHANCFKKASVCQYANWSASYSQLIGEPQTTHFEMRTSPWQKEPKLALVTHSIGPLRVRAVAFLTCNRNLVEPKFEAEPFVSSERDPDMYQLYFFKLEGAAFCPKPTACTPDFKEGSCVCRLADGSGTVDLTKYAEMTKNIPLTASDPDNAWIFDYAFCNTIKVDPFLTNCYNKGSVCQYNKEKTEHQIIGDPETTRFEVRMTPTTPPKRKLALITEAESNGINVRSVAFLSCNHSITGTPKFMPARFHGAQDEDGYLLYHSELQGAEFCAKPPASPCKPNPAGTSKCVCDLADGSGKIDLTNVANSSEQHPYITSNGRFQYSYVFCGTLIDRRFPYCNKQSAICEYSTVWGYNMPIGQPSTFRFEVLSTRLHPVASLALVADSDNWDGTFRRSVAFLNCKPGQYGIKFDSTGYQGDVDADGYMINHMEFTGAQFCPEK